MHPVNRSSVRTGLSPTQERKNESGTIAERQATVEQDESAARIRGSLVGEATSQRGRQVFSYGAPALLTAQNEAQLATWRAEVSRGLAAFVRVTPLDDEQSGSALSVRPVVTGAGLGSPIGGAVVVAKLVMGQDGISWPAYFNIISGEIVRYPMAGESAQLSTVLQPRYYNADDTVPANGRSYSVGIVGGAGSFPLTNEVWNTPTQNQLQQVLGADPGLANIFVLGVTCYGAVAESGANSTAGNIKAARRIFYGSCPTGAAVPAWTNCPVAYGSRYVRLVAPSAPAASAMQITFSGTGQRVIAGGRTFGDVTGQIGAQVDVPIPSETTSLRVSYVAGPPAATVEQAFELHFYESI